MIPLVKFHQLIASARAPERADRSANGTIPTRAFRYCEAVTTASALGWYVFPPIAFGLLFDGHEVGWACEAFEGYIPFHEAQFPYLSAKFDETAPSWARGYCPPFLSALPEPGMIQVWSGLFARTRANHSLIIRPPVNHPRNHGYDLFEGVIESDKWFGPLFTNVKLTRTDFPVLFNPTQPLCIVQPIHRSMLTDETLNNFEITPIGDFTDRDWQDFRETVVSRNQRGCPLGEDAVARRKRVASDRRISHLPG